MIRYYGMYKSEDSSVWKWATWSFQERSNANRAIWFWKETEDPYPETLDEWLQQINKVDLSGVGRVDWQFYSVDVIKDMLKDIGVEFLYINLKEQRTRFVRIGGEEKLQPKKKTKPLAFCEANHTTIVEHKRADGKVCYAVQNNIPFNAANAWEATKHLCGE